MDKKLWFKNKRYGWGWRPATIEGWIATVIYALVTMAYPFSLMFGLFPFSRIGFFSYLIATTTIFIFLCYKKGEKPRWRWGDDD